LVLHSSKHEIALRATVTTGKTTRKSEGRHAGHHARTQPAHSSPACNVRPSQEVRRSQEDLLAQYTPLVKSLASRMHSRLPQCVDLDDLVQAGIIGLWDAIQKFDSNKQVPFPLYAKFRIRGEMLDSLRRLDTLTRAARQARKQCDAQECSEAYCHLTADSRTKVLRRNGDSDDTTIEFVAGPEASPEMEYEAKKLKQILAEAATHLPERYRQVISLYYESDLTMKEVGEVMGVQESRVSQIHKSALAKMGAALTAKGLDLQSALRRAM
jgi:RNA polymerase sigma factor FliA